MEDTCEKCGYPKRDPCYGCEQIEANKKRTAAVSRARFAAIARSLGGARCVLEFTRERFKVSHQNRAVFRACDSFSPESENLYLWSQRSGTGKSHLAIIAARKFIEAGVVGRIVKPAEIFREIRRAYDEGSKENDADILGELIRLPILVLDDLGTQKDTEWSNATFYDLIEGRYSHRPGGLIVTANLSLEQAEARWGTRIGSRFAQMFGKLVFDLSAEKDHRRIA